MRLKYSSCSILIIIVVCVLLSVYLLPADTFFTCDNGMKYLQVVYLVKSGFRSDGIPYAGKFIDPEEKYFPILSPFAYRIGGPTYPEYPLLFACLSAVPYIIFGFRGLYLLPILSTIASLVVLLRLLKLLGIVDERRRALVILFYALGTPIFFYSLLFWEHTFCVLLFLAAVYFICRGIKEGGVRSFVAAGLFIGFSAWARLENLAYCAACVMALLFVGFRRLRFLVSLVLPVTAFVLLLFLFNGCYYGHPLGPHVIQVLRAKLGVAGHLRLASRLLFAPVSGLLVMCPFMLVVGAGRDLLGAGRPGEEGTVRAMVRFIYLTTVISIVLVVLTAYNDGGRQWGPRYLLPVIPLGVVLLAVEGGRAGRALRGFIIFVVTVSVCISLLGVGLLYKRKVYDLYPAVSWIKRCECECIVFPSTYAVLEMAAAFPDRTYFLALRFGDFLEIACKLKQYGKNEIAACRWEEGSFADLYERHTDHELRCDGRVLYLKRDERCRVSKDYTFYRWGMSTKVLEGDR